MIYIDAINCLILFFVIGYQPCRLHDISLRWICELLGVQSFTACYHNCTTPRFFITELMNVPCTAMMILVVSIRLWSWLPSLRLHRRCWLCIVSLFQENVCRTYFGWEKGRSIRFGEESMYWFHLEHISPRFRPSNIPLANAICMFGIVPPVLSRKILHVVVVSWARLWTLPHPLQGRGSGEGGEFCCFLLLVSF